MLDYASFPDQRQAFIKDRLLQDGRVLCIQLANELAVSEHTIRRDLHELAKQGVCKKVYGGAVRAAVIATDLSERLLQNSLSKSKLGVAAAKLLQDGTCVFIDSGSTNMAIAKAVSVDLNLTFVTNSPDIAIELLKRSKCEIILVGGKLHKMSGAAVGISAIKQIEKMYFDQCFLGTCAIDTVAGVTAFDFEDAEFKRALVQQSSDVVVAVTADKLGTIAKYRVLTAESITTVIVDGVIPEQQLALFSEQPFSLHCL